MRNIKNCYYKEEEYGIWFKERASFYVDDSQTSISSTEDKEIYFWRNNEDIRIIKDVHQKIKRIKPSKSQS